MIGTRSFGADPRAVAVLGVRAIAAYQAAGIVAVGKHFPGHGDTDVDSHMALPVIDKSPGDLEAFELIPFHAAVAAGVDAIMTAHIDLPQITAGEPATLAPQVLTDLLRTRMGFDGLIITDDLEMGAISKHDEIESAVVRAFHAGNDMMLICARPDIIRRGYHSMVRSARDGKLSSDRVESSLKQIQARK